MNTENETAGGFMFDPDAPERSHDPEVGMFLIADEE